MATPRCSADGWSRPRKWDQSGRPATSHDAIDVEFGVLTFGCQPEEPTPVGMATNPSEISVTALVVVTTLGAMGLALTWLLSTHRARRE